MPTGEIPLRKVCRLSIHFAISASSMIIRLSLSFLFRRGILNRPLTKHQLSGVSTRVIYMYRAIIYRAILHARRHRGCDLRAR
ncbi:unnamed protein product [Periconia digitata]|uniref:Uncharacterized protein n=1 Tax=Periconia digitata TaxID=1303443 RepID=A0A9W4XMC1_9PLEO|nr:unnamed protein product [Periconia digitata]